MIIRGTDFLKGESRPVTIQITRKDKLPLAITSASCQVFDEAGTAVGNADSANVTASGATAEITGVIDAGIKSGKYYAEFTCNADPYVIKARVMYRVE